ncbi:MAG TPA: Bax inhibitor-1/YccA family protein [Ignavibacteria bacterium]|nr:Bax inhibitor-1/YccA family protein [Ignavibacteria bacterium]HRF66693.1 Bax inhibitor-1/YccA family protein [Ignavibacteria bacterium]HRJ05901.1 Bax inhibitor-1/YccA family protein [Ignavibacteria bacterium]
MEPIPVMQDAYTGTRDHARTFILKVYMWMSLGLFITAGVSISPFLVLSETQYINLISEYIFVFYGLLIVEFLIVLGLSFLINKMPAILGLAAFLFYSLLNGITLSPIFIIYTGASIFSTFLICAMMFGGTSILGFITKMDLSKFGGYLTMALIGLIVAMVVNIFLNSSMMSWIISFVGVLLFVGLTAYDTQKIKNMAGSIDSASEDGKKASIMGALTLYLDFINLFLFLLRLLGKRN